MSSRRIARTYALRAGLLLVLAAAVPAVAGCGVSGMAVPSYSRPLGMAVQEPAGRNDAAYLRAFVDIDHIKTVVAHFRGKVASWDVVNEPFDDDGGFTPNLFFRVLGLRTSGPRCAPTTAGRGWARSAAHCCSTRRRGPARARGGARGATGRLSARGFVIRAGGD
jgi:hypothetical protein